LVKTVVPEELNNLDGMLLQLRGREKESLAMLNAMRRQSKESNLTRPTTATAATTLKIALPTTPWVSANTIS